MIRYYVTIQVDGDPLRTRDYSIEARTAYQAGWLYKQLNPRAVIAFIRPAPDHRQ